MGWAPGSGWQQTIWAWRWKKRTTGEGRDKKKLPVEQKVGLYEESIRNSGSHTDWCRVEMLSMERRCVRQMKESLPYGVQKERCFKFREICSWSPQDFTTACISSNLTGKGGDFLWICTMWIIRGGGWTFMLTFFSNNLTFSYKNLQMWLYRYIWISHQLPWDCVDS